MGTGRKPYGTSIDRIDFRHLRAFAAVANCGSYSRAAQELGYTEPAVHLQVKALCDATGGALFTRSKGRMQLTELGKAILPEAHEALKSLATLMANAEGYQLTLGRRLRVGIGRWSGDYVASPVLDAFSESHPEIACEWKTAPPKEIIAGVQRGDLDVGLAFSLRGDLSGDLVGVTWRSYRLQLCATPALWIAAKKERHLRIGFPGTPQYPEHPTPPDRPQWSDFAEAIMAWCRQSRMDGDLVAFDSIEAAKAVAVAGQMASCLPEFAVLPEVTSGSLVPVHIDGRKHRFPIDLIHQRPARNAAVEQFVSFLKKQRSRRACYCTRGDFPAMSYP